MTKKHLKDIIELQFIIPFFHYFLEFFLGLEKIDLFVGEYYPLVHRLFISQIRIPIIPTLDLSLKFK